MAHTWDTYRAHGTCKGNTHGTHMGKHKTYIGHMGHIKGTHKTDIGHTQDIYREQLGHIKGTHRTHIGNTWDT